jgi:cell shape-determining protein MreC
MILPCHFCDEDADDDTGGFIICDECVKKLFEYDELKVEYERLKAENTRMKDDMKRIQYLTTDVYTPSESTESEVREACNIASRYCDETKVPK